MHLNLNFWVAAEFSCMDYKNAKMLHLSLNSKTYFLSGIYKFHENQIIWTSVFISTEGIIAFLMLFSVVLHRRCRARIRTSTWHVILLKISKCLASAYSPMWHQDSTESLVWTSPKNPCVSMGHPRSLSKSWDLLIKVENCYGEINLGWILLNSGWILSKLGIHIVLILFSTDGINL